MLGLGRLRRQGRRLRGRLGRPAIAPEPEAVLAGALLPALRLRGAPDAAALRAAFRPVHDAGALAAIVKHPGADRGLRDLATGLLEGRLPFLDHMLRQTLPPDWRRVPGAGHWPLLPAAVYDHRDFTAHGDVRLLWELGRLQILPPLTAAAHLAMNEYPDAAEERIHAAFECLRDFRRRNPPGWGPHWVAGLESGLRIFSLLWTWQLLPPGLWTTDDRSLLLAASLLENGRFTASHLSEREIANNHLIGEATALYCLGCALPVFPESAAWREKGRAVLDRELPLQVPADGVLAEQAVEYHRFVLEFLLQALLWGRAAGETPPPLWRNTLAAMFPPLAALTNPEGELVSLGDDDSGRILRLDSRRRRDARGLLALGSRLLALPDLAAQAGDLDGEALWLGGAGLAGTAPVAATPAGNAAFAEAGWYVARFGAPVAPDGLPGGHLVFKAGPMGRGGAGHGHADALSLCLSLAGRPLLVDPGTYLYNGPQHWRDHFRGARAHNLLRVGGRDPATPHPAPDRFGWSRKSMASLIQARSEDALLDWTGRREGDRDPAGRPLSVTRRLLLLGPELLLVEDRVKGAEPGGKLAMELCWQAAPGLELAAGAEVALESELPGLLGQPFTLVEAGVPRLWILCFAPHGLDSWLRMGDQDTPGGWFSTGYAEREPAPAFGLAGGAVGSFCCLTLLACPDRSELRALRLKAGPDDDFILEVSRKLAEIKQIELARCHA